MKTTASLAIVAVLLLSAACDRKQSTSPSTELFVSPSPAAVAQNTPAAMARGPDTTFSADEVCSAYGRNKIAFYRNHKGHIIRITGAPVMSINQDSVMLRGSSCLISARFDASAASGAESLSNGGDTTVMGLVTDDYEPYGMALRSATFR